LGFVEACSEVSGASIRATRRVRADFIVIEIVLTRLGNAWRRNRLSRLGVPPEHVGYRQVHLVEVAAVVLPFLLLGVLSLACFAHGFFVILVGG